MIKRNLTKAQLTDIAHSNASCAIDQEGAYPSLRDACYAYAEKVNDTVAGQGGTFADKCIAGKLFWEAITAQVGEVDDL